MSAATRVRFRDIDVVLNRDNLIVTVFGMVGAFITGSFDVTWFNLENLFGFPVAPTTLVFNLAIIFFVVGYTKNAGSTLLVTFSAVLGLTNNYGSPSIALFETYFGVLLLTTLLTGFLVSKFSQIISWSTILLLHTLIFVIFSMSIGHFARVVAPKYWLIGNELGIGGTFAGIDVQIFGGPLPLADFILSLLVILVMVFLFFRTRSKDIYSSDTASKLSIFGTLLILLGFISTLVPAILFTEKLDQSSLTNLSSGFYLEPLFDLFTESANGSVFVSPANIFFSSLLSTFLFNVGIILRMIASKRDTLAWREGGFDMILLSPSIFIMLFFVFGLKPIQDLAYHGGTFVALELFPIYYAEIWTAFIWNVMIAWLALAIIGKLRKNRS